MLRGPFPKHWQEIDTTKNRKFKIKADFLIHGATPRTTFLQCHFDRVATQSHHSAKSSGHAICWRLGLVRDLSGATWCNEIV